MGSVGVENEEDLHERSTIFSTGSWIPCGASTTLLFKEHFCCHIAVAFKEHQRYITPHETMTHLRSLGLTARGCGRYIREHCKASTTGKIERIGQDHSSM